MQWEGNITAIRKFMYKHAYKFKREELLTNKDFGYFLVCSKDYCWFLNTVSQSGNVCTASKYRIVNSLLFNSLADLQTCSGRDYKTPNTHYTLLLLHSPSVGFPSLHRLLCLQFLTCISRCCQVSSVYRMWCSGDRHHRWPDVLVSGVSHTLIVEYFNTLRTGHLNCLNACSRGLNNLNQLLYCVSLKIYNKFVNYFCELKFSGNTHQGP